MTPSIVGLHVRPRPPGIHGRQPFPLNDFLQGIVDRIRGSALTPYVGVTADGTVRPGLHALQPTGVSTAPMLKAARDLLESLSTEQRAAARLDLESHEWRTWSNISPFLLRHGVLLDDLGDEQRDLALE